MAYKLNQMNEVLKQLKSSIDEDTLLLVFGDHGMTEDGNHGGSTELETDSALFAYSKRTINLGSNRASVPSADKFQKVDQIDLVPTICTLLGVPIPFGNLGFAIPELLAQRGLSDLPDADLETLIRVGSVALANANQVMRYLTSYSATTRQFPVEELERVQQTFARASENLLSAGNSRPKLSKAIQQLYDFHSDAVAICRRLWTTFDSITMWIGVFGGAAAAGSALVAALSRLDELSSRRLILLTIEGAAVGAVAGGFWLGFTWSVVPAIAGLAAIGSGFFFSIVSGLVKPVVMGALQLLFPAQFEPTSPEEDLRASPPRPRAASTEVGDFGTICVRLKWATNIRFCVPFVDLFSFLAPYKAPVSEYGWLFGLVALACLFLRAAGLWSNSYIESEDKVSSFLLATLAAVFSISSFAPQGSRQMVQRTVVLYLVLKLSEYVTAGKHESFLSSGTTAFSVFLQTIAPMMALPPAALALSEIYESYAFKSSPKRSSYWIRMWLHTCVAAVLTFWTFQWFGLLESMWVVRIAIPQFVFIGSVVALLLRFVYQSSQRLHFVFGWIATVGFPPMALVRFVVLTLLGHCLISQKPLAGSWPAFARGASPVVRGCSLSSGFEFRDRTALCKQQICLWIFSRRILAFALHTVVLRDWPPPAI